jgi:hypothetical protein
MKKTYLLILILNLVATITRAQSSTATPTLFTAKAVEATTLAGTGFRPVYASPTGMLTTNYTAPTVTKIDTSYYSVPAAEFRRSQGGNVFFSNGEISGAVGSTDTLIAPVNLPHGAIIKKFTFCYKDNTGNTCMQAQLMNITVNQPNRTVLINTAVTSSTVVAGNNYGCVNAPNIAIPTIGNNKASYWIRVIPKSEQGNDFDAWVAAGGLRIVHFLIEYTITH